MAARKLKGYTQTALAKAVGVTPRAISKYEKDGTGLSVETLSRIASVLNFDSSFFELGDLPLIDDKALSFRARSKMSRKSRDKAVATSVMGVELANWMDAKFDLPQTDVPDLGNMNPETAAESLRMMWGLGEGPIADMVSLLESRGIRVFSVSEKTEEIDAFSFWDEDNGRPFVFLTTAKSGERRRMDAAHELGHIVLHRKTDIAYAESRIIEREANTFASAFLMPSRGFRSTLSGRASLGELMKVKKFWKVSGMAAAYRAHAMGILSDWQYHSICVDMNSLGMRRSEPDGIEPECSQISQQVLNLARREMGGVSAIARETSIPRGVIVDLMEFRKPLDVINGRA